MRVKTKIDESEALEMKYLESVCFTGPFQHMSVYDNALYYNFLVDEKQQLSVLKETVNWIKDEWKHGKIDCRLVRAIGIFMRIIKRYYPEGSVGYIKILNTEQYIYWFLEYILLDALTCSNGYVLADGESVETLTNAILKNMKIAVSIDDGSKLIGEPLTVILPMCRNAHGIDLTTHGSVEINSELMGRIEIDSSKIKRIDCL